MYRIATDYLDKTSVKYPEKVAFVDKYKSITFSELQENAKKIATSIIELGLWKKPICIFLDKSVEVICAFQGVSYSGNFYSPLDTKMPEDRINTIIEKLSPEAIITDNAHKEIAASFSGNFVVLSYEEMMKKEINHHAVKYATDHIIDSDILYVLFTSGSTGTPKGVIISHRGIIDLTEWITEELGFSVNSIMANQAPFYFSFSVYEIFQTLKNGATTYIVPKELFSYPERLMEYLTDNQINTVIWVPSVLQLISTFMALGKPHCNTLQYVFFGAESMQVKHLNRWMDEYPNARFFNLFGPTEVTDTCNFYEITRRFEEGELLPIGEACKNKDVFLLDENNQLITPDQTDVLGEICMRGSGIAYGYYNDPEKTAEVFVQNPLNSAYREYIYRLGDLGKYNELRELVYVCRKDYQIKYKGHRIELGEIETAVLKINGVDNACCVFDEKFLRLVLFFEGQVEEKAVLSYLKNVLPDYMIPNKRIKLDKIPHNLNGKTDRQALKNYLKK